MSAIPPTQTGAAKQKSGIVVIGLLASLAGLMFGLDIGVISGAQEFIQKDFQISDHYIEWIVSSMMAGAALGALGCGWLSATLGRKRSLLLGGVLFVIGSLLCAFTPSAAVLLPARFLLGIAIGISSYTAPLYIAEIAPEQHRGAMISTYQLMLTIGILAAFLSDTAFSYTGAWRWMLGIIALPGALFLIGVMALPDSPRWLLMRGRKQEADEVLMRLRGHQRAQVDKEVTEIEEQLRKPQKGWSLFFENKNFRRSVGLGVLLQTMQQFTGMNVVMYYAPRIFKTMGYATEAQMWFTAVVGLTNVLATFIAMGVIDRWGRKPTLYTGFVVMAVGLGVVGTMMHGGAPQSHEAQLFTVAMLLIFIVGFAMSAGPLIWALCSEIQPLKGRDFGVAASTFTNWVTNMIVGATFLSLLNGIGTAQTFWLYAALNAAFLLLTWWLVPETKGVTLEHIEKRLMAGEKLRHIGR